MRQIWYTVLAVAWAFLGVRKNSEAQKDITKITPLHIVIVGLAAALLFVAMLIGFANFVVTKL